MIHILREGLPLCGFTAVLPMAWPAGHRWVSIADPDGIQEVTCRECLRARIMLLAFQAGAEEPIDKAIDALTDSEMTALSTMVAALRTVAPPRRLDIVGHFARLLVVPELAARFFPDGNR